MIWKTSHAERHSASATELVMRIRALAASVLCRTGVEVIRRNLADGICKVYKPQRPSISRTASSRLPTSGATLCDCTSATSLGASRCCVSWLMLSPWFLPHVKVEPSLWPATPGRQSTRTAEADGGVPGLLTQTRKSCSNPSCIQACRQCLQQNCLFLPSGVLCWVVQSLSFSASIKQCKDAIARTAQLN